MPGFLADSTKPRKPCGGCGVIFAFQEAQDSDCLRCIKLESIPFDTPEYTATLKWLQCVGCGLSTRNLQLNHQKFCFVCQTVNPRPQSQPANEPADQSVGPVTSEEPQHSTADILTRVNVGTQFALTQATAARLKKKGPQGKVGRAPLTEWNVGTTSAPFTGEQVSTYRNFNSQGQGKDLKLVNRNFAVLFEFRIESAPKSIYSVVGQVLKLHKDSAFLPDVAEEAVRGISFDWEKVHKGTLTNDEWVVRWTGNTRLEPGTFSLPLGEFYDYYSTNGLVKQASKNLPKAFTQCPCICLEILISDRMFKERMSLVEENAEAKHGSNFASTFPSSFSPAGSQLSKKSGKKRVKRADANESSDDDSESRRSKRDSYRSLANPRVSAIRRAGVSKGSLFGQSINKPLVQTRETIRFSRITCTLDPDTLRPSFLTSQTVYNGSLATSTIGKGAMKEVCELTAFSSTDAKASTMLVAKRFYRTKEADNPESGGEISEEEQFKHLTEELARISIAHLIFEDFSKRIAENGIVASTNLGITEAWIAKEDSFSQRTWLVEPRRSTQLRRFSGTMDHGPSPSNSLEEQTVAALAHHSLRFTNNEIVLADLQGTSGLTTQKRDGMVLFDVMTHTVSGNSGIGDYGQRGIDKFIADHRCNRICNALLDTFPVQELNPEETTRKADAESPRASAFALRNTPELEDIP